MKPARIRERIIVKGGGDGADLRRTDSGPAPRTPRPAGPTHTSTHSAMQNTFQINSDVKATGIRIAEL
jgi:hypothetical protein